MSRLKTLVVDDSASSRVYLKHIIQQVPACEYIGAATHGKEALEMIETLQPDIVTLDMEMPVLDGIGVLKALRDRRSTCKVIVISSYTQTNGNLTLEALDLGAFDFIPKVDHGDLKKTFEEISEKFGQLVNSVVTNTHETARLPKQCAAVSDNGARRPKASVRSRSIQPQVVAIGTSTGGPQALKRLLTDLPGHIDIPILVVQHMPSMFTRSLAESLRKHTAFEVKEAEDREVLEKNHVYLAPGGRQMKVEKLGGRVVTRITDVSLPDFCKPSVNYLFSSVAEVFGGNALGIIMTGIGNDGTEGLRQMKAAGAVGLCQDQSSSTAYDMPRSAILEGLVDEEVPLHDLADTIFDYAT